MGGGGNPAFRLGGAALAFGTPGTYLLPPIIFADPTFAYAAIVGFEDNRMSHYCMIVGARKAMAGFFDCPGKKSHTSP